MANRQTIKDYLLARDSYLIPVLDSCPFPRSRKNKDIYLALLSSIVSQQLSIKAADTIFNRLLDLFDDRYPHPEKLRNIRTERLRKAGLSQQKAGYVKNVARFALQGDELSYGSLRRQTDEDIINSLTQIKGVGRWTVEMLLMFPLDRKDIIAVDDLGIQLAMKRLYRLDQKGRELKIRMVEIAEHWKPYRSVVCKYLWHWKSIV